MIIRPALIPMVPIYDGFTRDFSEDIDTNSRSFRSDWVDPDDHTKKLGALVWTPIMLPVNGCGGFGGSVDLPDLATKSWSATATFKLLDEESDALWTMVTTLTYDIAYDVSAFPPATLINSHGSLSNGYPDGLSYYGAVNGCSIDIEWSPTDEDVTPPYFSAHLGTFEILLITGCMPKRP